MCSSGTETVLTLTSFVADARCPRELVAFNVIGMVVPVVLISDRKACWGERGSEASE
jgi:hypothetical protein